MLSFFISTTYRNSKRFKNKLLQTHLLPKTFYFMHIFLALHLISFYTHQLQKNRNKTIKLAVVSIPIIFEKFRKITVYQQFVIYTFVTVIVLRKTRKVFTSHCRKKSVFEEVTFGEKGFCTSYSANVNGRNHAILQPFSRIVFDVATGSFYCKPIHI